MTMNEDLINAALHKKEDDHSYNDVNGTDYVADIHIESDYKGDDSIDSSFSWAEISGNLSENRDLNSVGMLPKSRKILKKITWVENRMDALKMSLGDKDVLKISGVLQLNFLKLVGPELTARDIIHRLLQYLHNHVIDAANITVCIPQYGDNYGKAINISSNPAKSLCWLSLRQQRKFRMGEFVLQDHAWDHPFYDEKDRVCIEG